MSSFLVIMPLFLFSFSTLAAPVKTGQWQTAPSLAESCPTCYAIQQSKKRLEERKNQEQDKSSESIGAKQAK